MAEENTTVETSADEIVINVMDGTLDLEPTRVTARTVGELKAANGWTGRVTVGGVVASDSTPLTADCNVVHQLTNKKGGMLV